MRRAGFTLVEALVALTLATILVGLVTSVFIAQSDFYDDVTRRSRVHADARSVVDVIAGDVRAATQGAFVVAGSGQLVVRVPLTVGVICAVSGSSVSTYLPRAQAGLDTAGVTGYAIRNGNGTWSWDFDDWNGLYDSDGTTIKDECGDIGMDTTGIPGSHFVALSGPGSGSDAMVGGALMLHREIELRFAASGLDPSQTGLFRGTYGSTLVEVASGLGSDADFSYRLKGQSGYSSSVTGANLADINAVRVTAQAVAAGGGGLDPYEYTITRDVPIRNERWN
ncbi:MAG: PilW family protein [Longimicrobiales bacterium]